MILRNCADGIERAFSHGGDVLNDGFPHDAFDCYRLLACGGDYAKDLNWNPEITKHNRRLFMQEKARAEQSKTQAIGIGCKPANGKASTQQTHQRYKAQANNAQRLPTVDHVDTEDSQPAKIAAIDSLFASIKNIGINGLNEVCKLLGWSSSEGSPKQKHYKVAIVHTIIETAKENNWHIIRDAGFFYIFDGAYWVALQDAEVKQLLKRASIKMGFTEIECRDANFVDKLFQQASQDGFFNDRNPKKKSIINLRNGSLVLVTRRNA